MVTKPPRGSAALVLLALLSSSACKAIESKRAELEAERARLIEQTREGQEVLHKLESQRQALQEARALLPPPPAAPEMVRVLTEAGQACAARLPQVESGDPRVQGGMTALVFRVRLQEADPSLLGCLVTRVTRSAHLLTLDRIDCASEGASPGCELIVSAWRSSPEKATDLHKPVPSPHTEEVPEELRELHARVVRLRKEAAAVQSLLDHQRRLEEALATLKGIRRVITSRAGLRQTFDALAASGIAVGRLSLAENRFEIRGTVPSEEAGKALAELPLPPGISLALGPIQIDPARP